MGNTFAFVHDALKFNNQSRVFYTPMWVAPRVLPVPQKQFVFEGFFNFTTIF